MTCYMPIKGWESMKLTEKGKRKIVFRPQEADTSRPVTVPCGQCDGCRKEYVRKWAARCVNEAACWEDNLFVTLTYNEENLPVNGTLVPRHLQNFMKYLRNEFGPGIRFYGCGEYGELGNRPHYHLLLFNHEFHDKKLSTIRNGKRVYVSRKLDKLWKKGLHEIGDVTWESAAYVARYCMKKIPEKLDPDHYLDREPEFVRMSRRPGIGAYFWEKYKRDILAKDGVVVNKKLLKPPKFYDKLLEKESPKTYEELKTERKKAMEKMLERKGSKQAFEEQKQGYLYSKEIEKKNRRQL